jgi:hypothetical protein
MQIISSLTLQCVIIGIVIVVVEDEDNLDNVNNSDNDNDNENDNEDINVGIYEKMLKIITHNKRQYDKFATNTIKTKSLPIPVPR